MAKLIAICWGHHYKTAEKRTPKFEDGTKIKEWEFNYPTAKKLGELLEHNGFHILYVSSAEEDTPLKTRIDTANSAKADLYISIHYNALLDVWRNGVGGIETYHHPNSSNGKRLAEFTHKHLINDTNMKNRGVKTANFHVLRETKMPAVLFECGFMDIRVESLLMLDEEYQWKCAKAITKGVCDYFNVEYKEPKPEPKQLYRIRKSWEDVKSQIGAYESLDTAKSIVDKNIGYNVYDENGELIYPERREIMQLTYTRLMKKSLKGEDIKNLQIVLNLLGYNVGTEDGIAGVKTDLGIRAFQKDNKLVVDGLVGKASIAMINELLRNKSIPANKPAQNKSKYYKKGDIHIIETTPDNIEIKILGNNLHSAKVFGVNGTFYNTSQPKLPDSCWAIATNNGKPIGGNSMLNTYQKSILRGTIIYYQDGTMEVKRVNSINEFTKPHIWSIGGYSIHPYFNLAAEKCPNGVNYKTHHSYIAWKMVNGKPVVYLFVKPNHMIKDILPFVKEMKFDGCVVLDGGGSSQLRHPNGEFKQSRLINNAILLKEV